MKKYLLLLFLAGCNCPSALQPLKTTEELVTYDSTIGIRRIAVNFPSAYSVVDNAIIDVINDELRFMNDSKIIAITDEPCQGGANAINILYTKDDSSHSYYCFVCKKPNVENLVAVTSISGWRGNVAYYLVICDKIEK